MLAIIVMACLVLSKAQELQVQELDSILLVQEPINTALIEHHLHLWAKDLGQHGDKLDKLMAARIMRESSLLLDTLTSTTQTAKQVKQVKDQSTSTNDHIRQKRNILGDFLHMVTGVATDDELQKQMKIDEEIREKITHTLSRQVAFEKSIAAFYGNLTREEEVMQKKLDDLYNQRNKDRAQTTRQMTLKTIAMEDIRELQDILTSIKTGEATIRQAIRLSNKAGLKSIADFQYSKSDSGDTGPVVTYRARLYSQTLAQVTAMDNYDIYETRKQTYAIHKGHVKQEPITEWEAKLTHKTCTNCAIVVHLTNGHYKTVQPGMITCNNQQRQLVMGEILVITPTDNCNNDVTNLKQQHTQIRNIIVKMDGDNPADIAFLKKVIEVDNLQVQQHTNNKQQHTNNNMKLQHELQMAQQDISNFIEETKTDMTVQYMQDTITWSAVGGMGLIVTLIVMCILGRCCINCKGSQPSENA